MPETHKPRLKTHDGTVRIAVTLAIFAAHGGPGGHSPAALERCLVTALGASAMLALGLVSPHQAIGVVLDGKNALLFLLSLLALSLLVGKSGFFEWAAIRCALAARGDAHSLYRNVFIAAPSSPPSVPGRYGGHAHSGHAGPGQAAQVPAAPYVVLCAFIANVGSCCCPSAI